MESGERVGCRLYDSKDNSVLSWLLFVVADEYYVLMPAALRVHCPFLASCSEFL